MIPTIQKIQTIFFPISKIKKLPEFLRGRAATHFYAIPDKDRESYDTAVKKLKEALCPLVERETYYVKFEARNSFETRIGEDPSIYRWELEQLLEKAEPTLGDECRANLCVAYQAPYEASY